MPSIFCTKYFDTFYCFAMVDTNACYLWMWSLVSSKFILSLGSQQVALSLKGHSSHRVVCHNYLVISFSVTHTTNVTIFLSHIRNAPALLVSTFERMKQVIPRYEYVCRASVSTETLSFSLDFKYAMLTITDVFVCLFYFYHQNFLLLLQYKWK